jgi:hypothetical protein
MLTGIERQLLLHYSTRERIIRRQRTGRATSAFGQVWGNTQCGTKKTRLVRHLWAIAG